MYPEFKVIQADRNYWMLTMNGIVRGKYRSQREAERDLYLYTTEQRRPVDKIETLQERISRLALEDKLKHNKLVNEYAA